MIPEEIKYNLHYDDLLGRLFMAATRHNTSYSRVTEELQKYVTHPICLGKIIIRM